MRISDAIILSIVSSIVILILMNPILLDVDSLINQIDLEDYKVVKTGFKQEVEEIIPEVVKPQAKVFVAPVTVSDSDSFATGLGMAEVEPEIEQISTSTPIIEIKPIIEITPILMPQQGIEPETAKSPTPPSESTPQPDPAPEITSFAKIVIFGPIPGKGLNRKYLARPIAEYDSNYIELGLIVYNDIGDITKNDKVVITATDESQNKTMQSTGNVTRYYDGERELTVHYYPFHYEFRTKGTHKIIFKTNGMEDSVSMDVDQDNRVEERRQ